MSRELEFRVWNGVNYLSLSEGLFHENVVIQHNRPESYELAIGYEGDVIEQYTGMNDKNGNKIFEGDILETPYEYTGNYYTGQEDDEGLYRGLVHFQPSKGFIQKNVIVKSDYDESEEWEKRDYLSIRQTYTRIIGNIHENPELLEQK